MSNGSNAGAKRWVIVYIAALASGTAILGLWLHGTAGHPPGRASYIALPLLAGLVVASEYLFVRYRFRGEINALNLVEAALAPLLFAFDPWVVMVTVAGSQMVAEALRRNEPIKAAFNIAQWTLAAGVGAAVLDAVTDAQGIALGTIGALLAAEAAVAVVNQAAFTLVLAIVNQKSPAKIVRSAMLLPGWAIPWLLNSLIGILFVLAYHGHPAAAILFPVPLAVLHVAYRGYAGARSDRTRLAGLHLAAQALSEPLDPRLAIDRYLKEVAVCFEAGSVSLVFRQEDRTIIHRFDCPAERYSVVEEPNDGPDSLERALLACEEPSRLSASKSHSLSPLLERSGWRDCLAAPLHEDGTVFGALVICDQAGLEGFEAGELAVVEALARETATTFVKGRLLETILEERKTLSDIVTYTSDGICTIDTEGVVRSWNPAMEAITGIKARKIVGVKGGLASFHARTTQDEPIDFTTWRERPTLPADLRLPVAGERKKNLSCSFSEATDDTGATTLVMVVRDVTPQLEMRELREQVGRLAEAEAAQRSTVEQLQRAVMPPRPELPGIELGVAYLSSDPASPTGGDMYDWHVLPSGELHLAVVDVLGHGVGATHDAVSVIHALRLLARQQCPIEEMIARADQLLASESDSVVATAILGRYDPSSGRLQLAGGGHPPPLIIGADSSIAQASLAGGAIGWPNAGSRMLVELTMMPGDALLFYTDGLVESRRNIIEGIETLGKHAAELRRLSPEMLAAQLLHRSLSGGDRRDDSLALVLRRTPSPAGAKHAFWRIPPDRTRVIAVRKDLTAWLTSVSVYPSQAKDVEMIAGELLANAVRKGRSTVSLRVWLDGSTLALEVEDDGRGREDLDRLGYRRPEPSEESGRGLFIVRSLADEVTVLSTLDGTIIRCAKQQAAAIPEFPLARERT